MQAAETRGFHPRSSQTSRLATLHGIASGQVVGKEGAFVSGEEIQKPEGIDQSERDESSDETAELDQVSAHNLPSDEKKEKILGALVNRHLANRKPKRVAPHSRKNGRDQKKKNMDSTIVAWMSRG